MNIKTPVSLLQEFAVKQKYPMPEYSTGHSDVNGFAFKCTVRVGKTVGTGFGSTKQSAKHQSAQKALEQFGIQIAVSDNNNNNNNAVKIGVAPPEPPKANVNYVGVLNELASTRGKPYPVYEDIPEIGPSFKIVCSFLTWTTEGNGTQKKIAKQSAAQKMLELAKNEKFSVGNPVNRDVTSLVPLHKQEQLEELTQRAIKKIEEMNFSAKPLAGLYEDIIPQIVSSNHLKNLEDLQAELLYNGYKSKVTTIQEFPFIVMLQLEGNSCVVMGQGSTKALAYNNLYESTLLMFIKNYNFRTYFDENRC